MSTPLKQLTTFIDSHTKFKGSSVTGTPRGELYDVYSYSTLIAVFKGLEFPKLTYFDDTSYSNTTAKLQHLIRENYTIGSMKLRASKTHKVHK